MSRNLTAAAAAAAEGQSHTLILLGKFEFSDPAYVHTGIGQIVYGGNTYIGVGEWGSVGEVRESENVSPLSVTFSLAAPNSSFLVEALDSGSYGDDITIYAAYRDSGGDLIADPWIVWSGTFEFAAIRAGGQNVITVTAQHDLAVLNEVDGSRFSDEDQQRRFPGDVGLEFIHEQATIKLVWGGWRETPGTVPDDTAPPGYDIP